MERKRIVLGATGNVDAAVVRGLAAGAEARALSFFDLKGDVEDLLAHFNHWELGYDALLKRRATIIRDARRGR